MADHQVPVPGKVSLTNAVEEMARELCEASATCEQVWADYPTEHWDELDSEDAARWRAVALTAIAFLDPHKFPSWP